MQRQAGEKTKEELERELEEGLRETFPASDPPTATQPVHHGRAASQRSCASDGAAAEPRRSVRRIDRHVRARTFSRQSRRALSSRRSDFGEAPLGLAAMDLLRAALQGPPAHVWHDGYTELFFLDEADRARGRASAVLRVPPRGRESVRREMGAGERRRRAARARDGSGASGGAAERPRQAHARDAHSRHCLTAHSLR